MDSTHFLALIPAYNEERAIGDVVRRTAAYLPVLVVDDGSSDETGRCAAEAGAELLTQVPNQGKGAALHAGFRWALENGYDGVVTLDADGQHDPDEIPNFLAAYAASQADLIIGVRDFSQMPTVRRMANTVGGKAFSWALGQPVADNQSGYRLLSRRMMEALPVSDEQGFEFEVEMIVVCVQQGYTLDWTPIRTIYAGESSHIQPLQHVLSFGRIVLSTRRAMRAYR